VEKGWMPDQAYPLVIEAEVGEAKQGLGGMARSAECSRVKIYAHPRATEVEFHSCAARNTV
jgi:hypothetical protein